LWDHRAQPLDLCPNPKSFRHLSMTGEKGRRIRELTSVVQKRFNFQPDSVELYAEKVADRGLCAVAQAESLRYKLLGGLAVRRCAASRVLLGW
jgi:small subunit ribosomal protein S3e